MNVTPATAYMLGFIFYVVFILISVVIANVIKYQPGTTPKDPMKRKIWFWILGVLCPVVVFAVGDLGFYATIKVASKANTFMNHLLISTVLSFACYIISGWALSKVFKHGKLSSWF